MADAMTPEQRISAIAVELCCSDQPVKPTRGLVRSLATELRSTRVSLAECKAKLAEAESQRAPWVARMNRLKPLALAAINWSGSQPEHLERDEKLLADALLYLKFPEDLAWARSETADMVREDWAAKLIAAESRVAALTEALNDMTCCPHKFIGDCAYASVTPEHPARAIVAALSQSQDAKTPTNKGAKQ